jgi:fimbrial chaperone protein
MLKILTLLSLLSFSLGCTAGAFSVTPVRLFFEPKDKAVAMTLMNESDEEIVLQADVYQWTQDALGEDKIEQTEDLIVSPPSLRLPPHSKQVIRLGLLVPRDKTRQMTYRLLVREIPEAEKRKDAILQLPIALVLNMPVFITPSGALGKLECGWQAGSSSFYCVNTGTAYAQVRSAELRRGGNLLAKTANSTYILPGARRSLTLQELANRSLEPGTAELTLVYDDFKIEKKNIDIH